MKAIHTFIFLILSLFSFSQQVTRSEMLGRPTDKSILIRMFFDESVEVSVEYGTQKGNYTLKTPWSYVDAATASNILLNDLLADTRYYYRVLYRRPGNTNFITRPEYTFHTRRNKGSSFTFVIQADPHLDQQSDTAVYNRCLQNQLEDNPDFMIDLGDIIMTDKLKNSEGKITRDTIKKRCEYLRSFYEEICHSVPLYMTLGNHEGEAGWTLNGNSENTAVWSTLERKKYFSNPIPDAFYTGDDTDHDFVGQRENYYSWTWGDALFIVLDPYWYTKPKPDGETGWRWTLGKKQYDWLRFVLENDQSLYKFVFCHQLIGGDPNGRGGIEFSDWYEWGGFNKDGSYGFSDNRPGWYKPVKDLLKENRVDIFFHGHDHFFGKQEKDCLIYQECPQPSHKNFTNANQAAEYGYVSGQILPNSGHLRIQVNEEEVKVEYVRAYSAANETPARKNKDIAATYFVRPVNCYDSLATGLPVIWNSLYTNELIYPNPSDDQTNISFTLHRPERISIEIADLTGNHVKTLVDDNLIPEGKYEIIWDGRNEKGQKVQAGNYIYVIRSGPVRLSTGQITRIQSH